MSPQAGAWFCSAVLVTLPALSQPTPVVSLDPLISATEPIRTVSTEELRNPPSKAALRAAGKAAQLAAAGDTVRAVQELRKAVKAAPAYSAAWNNLGLAYLQLKQVGAGIAALRQAARLAPNVAWIHTNLAYAYSIAREPDQAEAEARAALKVDRRYARAHFLLGHFLLKREGRSKEAEEHLKLASEEFPSSRLTLAEHFIQTAQNDAAAEQLRLYLGHATSEGRVIAQRWLSRLGQSQTEQADDIP